MGILNVTPDSFSDGGLHNTLDKSLKHAEKMINEGADIIDIGGESTRPGYTLLSDEEEIERVCPVIEKVRSSFDIPISLDTYKSAVAEASLKAGAHMINDIWGLKWDNRIASVIAKYDAACCIMHNRKEDIYPDFLIDILADLNESLDIADKAGINKSRICIDPGIRFAKTKDENLILMNNLQLLQSFDLPILLGTSKKSMIGLTLNVPVDERMPGTVATSVLGYLNGCSIFRVHDVKENYEALKMTKAIITTEKRK